MLDNTVSMRGKLIVLDGADGAGKDTQADRLLAHAKGRGISAAIIRFPAYEQTFSGKEVRAYQSGRFGELINCHPKLISYLYAVDRFEMQSQLHELLNTHELVIAARYVISNIAYQAARLPKEERPAFRTWAETLDYEVLHNPREDAVIFLSLPTALSDQLIAKRQQETEGARDIHDENARYREEVLGEYETLCASHDHWFSIQCNDGDQIRSIEDIATELDRLVFERVLATVETA